MGARDTEMQETLLAELGSPQPDGHVQERWRISKAPWGHGTERFLLPREVRESYRKMR